MDIILKSLKKYLKKKIMSEDYCEVILDLSKGSAYEYHEDSEIPTKIKFGRKFSGKFQEGIVEGNFSNKKTHDIVFSIKRGCELSEIEERSAIV